MPSALRHLLLCCALLCSGAVLANTAIYLNPQAGSVASYELSAPVFWQHGIDGQLVASPGAPEAGATFLFQELHPWVFQFAAPKMDAAPLQTGMYSQIGGMWGSTLDRPEMLISSPFGSNIAVSGWFHVREVGYASDGLLTSFAVDFRQFDTLDLFGPSLYGSLRYNSTLDVTMVPEPATWALLLIGLALIGVAARGQLNSLREPGN